MGSRGPHRLSAAKPPQSPAASAPPQSKGLSETSFTVKTGRSAERRPTEAKAHVLHHLFSTLAGSLGFAVGFKASKARLRPPLSHSSPAQGHTVGPALLPSSWCAEAARPGSSMRVRVGLGHFRLCPTTLFSSAVLAPVGANGLSQNKPKQPNAQALLHTR